MYGVHGLIDVFSLLFYKIINKFLIKKLITFHTIVPFILVSAAI